MGENRCCCFYGCTFLTGLVLCFLKTAENNFCHLLLDLRSCYDFSEAKIRLVNSKTSKNNTGRIEVYHPSFGWGTVCDDGWGETESNVACRQLGFIGANATRKEAYFGRGSGPILLDGVQCTGKESYIWDCRHWGWNDALCDHHQDVGVECY